MKLIYWFTGLLNRFMSGLEFSVSDYYLLDCNGSVGIFRVAQTEDFFYNVRYFDGDFCLFRIGLMRDVVHRKFRLLLKDGDKLVADPKTCELVKQHSFFGVISERELKVLPKRHQLMLFGYRVWHGNDLTVDTIKSLLGDDVVITEIR